MDAPNSFYLADKPIKKRPTLPARKMQPPQIPAYKKRDISKVVEKNGIEILGMITCNVLGASKVPRGKSAQELKDSCLNNGLWNKILFNKKTYGKLIYAEMLMKI
jgi:hypothetical protein